MDMTPEKSLSCSFIDLLKKAIGNKPQYAYAADAGITPEHLSRLLRGTTKPRAETLLKLAQASDGLVTVEDFQSSLGRTTLADVTGSVIFRQKLASVVGLTDMVKLNAEDLRRGLDVFVSDRPMWYSTKDLMDTLLSVYTFGQGITCHSIETKSIPFAQFTGTFAELWGIRFDGETADYLQYIMLVYIREEQNRIYLTRYVLNKESIVSAGFLLPQAVSVVDDVCYLKLDDGDASLRMLNSILSGEKYDGLFEGVGFALQFDRQSFAVVRDFIWTHRKTYESIMGVKLLSPTEISKHAVLSTVDEETGAQGSGAIIAKIMRAETGMPFALFDDPEHIYQNNPACVMISDDYQHREYFTIIRHIVLDTIYKYAKELGVARFGRCRVKCRMCDDVNDIFDVATYVPGTASDVTL